MIRKENDKIFESLVLVTAEAPSTNLPAVVPAQTALPLTIKENADQINAAHSRSVQDIFDTARRCFEAKTTWKGRTKELLSHLIFDGSQFSRYCSLHSSDLLRLNADHLPPSQTTMDILRKLDKETFEKYVKEKKIHPGMTRQDARKLVPAKAEAETQTPQSSDDSVGGALRRVVSPSIADGGRPLSFQVDWNYEKHQSQSFENWLNEGRGKFGVDVLNWNDRPSHGIRSSSFVDEVEMDEDIE